MGSGSPTRGCLGLALRPHCCVPSLGAATGEEGLRPLSLHLLPSSQGDAGTCNECDLENCQHVLVTHPGGPIAPGHTPQPGWGWDRPLSRRGRGGGSLDDHRGFPSLPVPSPLHAHSPYLVLLCGSDGSGDGVNPSLKCVCSSVKISRAHGSGSASGLSALLHWWVCLSRSVPALLSS